MKEEELEKVQIRNNVVNDEWRKLEKIYRPHDELDSKRKRVLEEIKDLKRKLQKKKD